MSALETCDDLADGKPPHSDSPSESTEWSAVGPERGYYRRDNVFIKRSIRPSEYITNVKETVQFPQLGKEKLQNKPPLRFIRHATNIPVPTVYGAFEMDGSYIIPIWPLGTLISVWIIYHFTSYTFHIPAFT